MGGGIQKFLQIFRWWFAVFLFQQTITGKNWDLNLSPSFTFPEVGFSTMKKILLFMGRPAVWLLPVDMLESTAEMWKTAT